MIIGNPVTFGADKKKIVLAAWSAAYIKSCNSIGLDTSDALFAICDSDFFSIDNQANRFVCLTSGKYIVEHFANLDLYGGTEGGSSAKVYYKFYVNETETYSGNAKRGTALSDNTEITLAENDELYGTLSDSTIQTAVGSSCNGGFFVLWEGD